MILSGVPARSIVLFTFTNKAAKEIRERIENALGEKSKGMIIGTYHSVCVRILREFGDRIGYKKNFSIYDMDETKDIQKKLSKKHNVDIEFIMSYISECKKKGLVPSKALNQEKVEYRIKLAEIYKEYQSELKKQNAMDFDDLILNVVQLFEKNEKVLEIINSRWKYITAKSLAFIIVM